MSHIFRPLDQFFLHRKKPMVLNVVILTLGGNQYENKILHSHNWNECQCCFCQPQCRVCSWLLFWCGAGRIEILNGRACIAFVRARKQFRRNLLNNKNKYFKVDYQHHNLTVFVIFLWFNRRQENLSQNLVMFWSNFWTNPIGISFQ